MLGPREIGILTSFSAEDSGLARSLIPKDWNTNLFDDHRRFLQSDLSRKIAIFDLIGDKACLRSFSLESFPLDKIDELIFLSSEMLPEIFNFMVKNDHHKITYFINGFLNSPLKKSKVRLFMDWFSTTVDIYKNKIPQLLNCLTPYETKPYAFDVLLGSKKPHRDKVYKTLTSSGLRDNCIMSYFGAPSIDLQCADKDRFIWYDKDNIDFKAINTVTNTVQRVNYKGVEMHLSQLMPINIYNETAHTLVTETTFDERFVFFTEKTVKPIIAKRLFIMLGNPGSLARLRDMGFMTFDGIIDESYDDELNHNKRFNKALGEFRKLCEMDQSYVLTSCRHIVDHNAIKMLETDWMRDVFLRNFYGIICPSQQA